LLEALPTAEQLTDVLTRWRLPGRQQQRQFDSVNWLLDVAHNEDSAALLAKRLAARPTGVSITLIIGMLADKPVAEVIKLLAPHVARWICVDLDGARALPVEELMDLVKPVATGAVEQSASIAGACALAHARTQSPDWIVVTGSFHSVGPALAWLGPDSHQ